MGHPNNIDLGRWLPLHTLFREALDDLADFKEILRINNVADLQQGRPFEDVVWDWGYTFMSGGVVSGDEPIGGSTLADEKAQSWVRQVVWAGSGFPRVQLPHTYAAVLMSTEISAEARKNVVLPWHNFIIEIQPGLLTFEGSDVLRLWVYASPHVPEKPRFLAQGPNGMYLGLCLNEEDSNNSSGYLHAFPGDRNALDRFTLLAQRLVIGVCVAMTEKALHSERTAPLPKEHHRSARRAGTEPVSHIFTVGQPVKLDLRQAVHDYLTGKSHGPVTVQTLVAGHWKNQPHGPKNSLRKWAHIEPYWRGPVDAPIVVREHELTDPGAP